MLRFGTDGVRGDAATELTPPLVEALGRAAVAVFGTDEPFVIGRDTRRSGPRIEDDVTRGIEAAGGTVESLGIVPTPAVAFVSQQHDVPGVVISASHNPYRDNGIKLFAPGGVKLSDAEQDAIELVLDEAQASLPARHVAPARAEGDAVDRSQRSLVEAAAAARDAYVEHLVAALDGRCLDGLHVVLDVANGAAFELAPRAFRAVGAQVDVLHDEPDGTNINTACGSTDARSLQSAVRAGGAALGLAFDGDADRCIAVDEHGRVIDGDQIMVALASDLAARGDLAGNTLVVTVLSNLGLHQALRASGIDVVTTPVGDRHVFAAMEAGRFVLGGEQSGHVIVRDRATTGDGTLVGLLFADLMVRSGRSAAALGALMVKLPQVSRNVRVGARPRWVTASSGARRCRRPSVTSVTGAGSWCARRAPNRWCG